MVFKIQVPIKKLHPDAMLPTYAHDGDAAMDIYALEADLIHVGETKIVKTGLAVAVPNGWEMQVRTRSGLSLKGVTVANGPGTIDSSYRGELGIILNYTPNWSVGPTTAPYRIRKGDRIAQILVMPVPKITWDERDELPDSERGAGGFGSSGV
jgi:dUTP pyrophosphatase